MRPLLNGMASGAVWSTRGFWLAREGQMLGLSIGPEARTAFAHFVSRRPFHLRLRRHPLLHQRCLLLTVAPTPSRSGLAKGRTVKADKSIAAVVPRGIVAALDGDGS